MKQEKLNKDTYAFTFDTLEGFETSVYVIEKKERIYIVDTFCGPDAMMPIIEAFPTMNTKEVVVINTHFHWDHIWGNCAFENNKIVSHRLCKQWVKDQWKKQIVENGTYQMGNVQMVLPNITFEDRLEWDDRILLFHSPGHTTDSISVFDQETGLLIVGDNLEMPLIYVEAWDLDAYIATLKIYTSLNPKEMTASHTLHIERYCLEETIAYLEALKKGSSIIFKDVVKQKIHMSNLNNLRTSRN
ncbi:MBL fold metallo-hydrolase [Petrocella atlantisensis]|uniref:MBL fold metallo-hydrolase n=1 Tax=Petrocella atlantisensis TaxID=2173034 RepID=A0A3P7PPK8_9FIRM|nr:MBL fold metallo-hydrolase [Petrocella atlantisensis]MCF8018395.1 MBL fold metallo-hydrolase [Vallitaleaceae bacterium]VDN46397.1 MBL fold metallo-hydrolase [Petrocella atlantisensis]